MPVSVVGGTDSFKKDSEGNRNWVGSDELELVICQSLPKSLSMPLVESLSSVGGEEDTKKCKLRRSGSVNEEVRVETKKWGLSTKKWKLKMKKRESRGKDGSREKEVEMRGCVKKEKRINNWVEDR